MMIEMRFENRQCKAEETLVGSLFRIRDALEETDVEVAIDVS